MRYLPEELDYFGGGGRGDWLDFDPLGKLVDCDDVGEPTSSSLEWGNQVKSAVGERLGGRYCV